MGKDNSEYRASQAAWGLPPIRLLPSMRQGRRGHRVLRASTTAPSLKFTKKLQLRYFLYCANCAKTPIAVIGIAKTHRTRYDLERMLPTEYENWARSAAPHFREAYGLEGNFALPVARLFVALWANGLNPRVTSGFRDPGKQKEMQARWDAGDRAGLRARPATNSAHSATGFLGRPAARAIDMVSSNERAAAELATRLKVGAGLYFQKSDPGHYYAL